MTFHTVVHNCGQLLDGRGRRNLARSHEPPKPGPSDISGLVALSRRPAVALSGRDRVLVRVSLHQIVPTRHCIPPGSRGGRREAYIPTKHPPPCEEARVPGADEHPRRSCGAQEPPGQGPRPTLGLIHRIRDRATFERLARDGTRIRRSALWCTWCPDPDSTAMSVAFAFGRAFGPAVHRNRIRRRLRAIMTELDDEQTLPSGLLLIGGRPQLLERTFDEMKSEMVALIAQLRSMHTPASHPPTPAEPRP